MTKRLYRSQTNRIIAGVCGGLGDYFDTDPVIFRLIFVVLTVLHGAGVLLYLLSWLIIPSEESVTDKASTKEEIKDSAHEFGKRVEAQAQTMAQEIRDRVKTNRHDSEARTIIAFALIVLGVLFLIRNVLNVDIGSFFVPALLIVLGVLLIARSGRKDKL